MEETQDEQPGLVRVRCLECGATYDKPQEGGIVRRNPGCPLCGYVGWEHVEGAEEPLRPAADPQLHLTPRPR
jgi:hypothetical protein